MSEQENSAKQAREALLEYADEKRAINNLWFFKTQPGQYGEGDKFIGVSMPNLRRVAARFRELPATDVIKLLHDKYHEIRLLGLIIINHQFDHGDDKIKEFWYKTYLKNTKYINNWDLVDSSAHIVVGKWLLDKPRDILYELIKSELIWDRRIAVLASFRFIKEDDFADCLELSRLLLNDEHDLMHKAVGWMLREIGKRDRMVLEQFLNKHYKVMPRTMLRYSIEKLPEDMRQDYLKGNI